jgi:hypothetical protein
MDMCAVLAANNFRDTLYEALRAEFSANIKSCGVECKFHNQVVDIGPLDNVGLKLPIREDHKLEDKCL